MMSQITQQIGNERSAKALKKSNEQSTLVKSVLGKYATDTALQEYQPYQKLEEASLASFGDLLGYNGADKQAAALSALQNSSAYKFRLNSGTAALDRSATSKGGLFSGAQQRELTKYGQDLGSQEYDNEYNRRKGMLDWAYGNAGNRASLKYSGITGEAANLSNYYTTHGNLNASTEQNRGGALQGAKNEVWSDVNNAVGVVSSLYGGGKNSTMSGISSQRNNRQRSYGQ